jgi:adenylate cyclase
VEGFGDRPTIAVLPFEDMSADGDRSYLADGLVEDLITRLSANRWFPVIARNSTFAYKGKAVDVRRVSRELGARYVVEGSVRAAGDRVRVTVQFIDGSTGEHLYAQRYDREMGDVFALQDELVHDIIGAVEPGVGRIDRMSVSTKPPEDLTTWECTKRGMECFYRAGRKDLREALELFEKAIELDPHQATAWSCISQVHSAECLSGFTEDREASIAAAIHTAERAIREDPTDALGPATLAMARTLSRDVDAAVALFERALELNPSQAPSYWGLGTIRLYQGDTAEARRLFQKTIRLSPHDPMLHHMETFLAAAHAAEGDLEEALTHARRSIQLRPDQPFAPVVVAACAAHLGRIEEGRQARATLAALAPGFGPAQLGLVLNASLVGFLEAGWELLDSPGS